MASLSGSSCGACASTTTGDPPPLDSDGSNTRTLPSVTVKGCWPTRACWRACSSSRTPYLRVTWECSTRPSPASASSGMSFFPISMILAATPLGTSIWVDAFSWTLASLFSGKVIDFPYFRGEKSEEGVPLVKGVLPEDAALRNVFMPLGKGGAVVVLHGRGEVDHLVGHRAQNLDPVGLLVQDDLELVAAVPAVLLVVGPGRGVRRVRPAVVLVLDLPLLLARLGVPHAYQVGARAVEELIDGLVPFPERAVGSHSASSVAVRCLPSFSSPARGRLPCDTRPWAGPRVPSWSCRGAGCLWPARCISSRRRRRFPSSAGSHYTPSACRPARPPCGGLSTPPAAP